MIGPGIPNPMMFAGGDPLDEFFRILRSVRFRSAATPRIERTTGASGGDRDKWFVLLNFKRATLGAIQYLHGADTSSPDAIYINASDKLCIDIAGTNRLVSSRVFRDPAAHYIVLVVFDAANATAASRLRVYVADSPSPEVTAWDTDTRSGITAGSSKTMHNSILHVIGKNPAAANGYFDGYISEHRIGTWSGAAPALVDHCSLHGRTGQWRPKAYTGSYGTHGSRLDFFDTSSLVNLCLDRSGNGNNWTATNISLTTGATYDSMLDTPTNNFATLNPIAKWTTATLSPYSTSNGNLTFAWSHTINQVGLFPLTFLPDHDAYFEATIESQSLPASASSLFIVFERGGSSVSLFNNVSGLLIQHNGSTVSATAQVAAGGTVCIRMNKSGAIDFLVGETLRYTSTLLTGFDRVSVGAGTYSSGTIHINCGQRPFAHPANMGVSKAISTKNLPLFSGVATISGTFAGNLSADGPFVLMNGSPETLTINGNPVTFGTHADRLSNGFKLRTASSSYNASGTNTWTATILSPSIKSLFRYQNARGNP